MHPFFVGLREHKFDIILYLLLKKKIIFVEQLLLTILLVYYNRTRPPYVSFSRSRKTRRPKT